MAIQFNSKSANPHYQDVFDVDPQEVLEKAQNLYIVDVRQPDEYTGELKHIANSQLIVLDTLPEHLETIPKNKDVVFVCHSGGRSARAAAFALQNGYSTVYNMRGGMLLWNDLKLPIESNPTKA